MKRVHRAFGLGRRCPNLETNLSIGGRLVKRLHAVRSHILEAVLDSLNHVRQELKDGTLILDGTRDTLSDANCEILSVIALGRASSPLLHCVFRTHATVAFESDSITVKELTRSLIGPCEHGAHHDGRGAERDGFDDMA